MCFPASGTQIVVNILYFKYSHSWKSYYFATSDLFSYPFRDDVFCVDYESF
jgi:hypothetical protein